MGRADGTRRRVGKGQTVRVQLPRITNHTHGTAEIDYGDVGTARLAPGDSLSQSLTFDPRQPGQWGDLARHLRAWGRTAIMLRFGR